MYSNELSIQNYAFLSVWNFEKKNFFRINPLLIYTSEEKLLNNIRKGKSEGTNGRLSM